MSNCQNSSNLKIRVLVRMVKKDPNKSATDVVNHANEHFSLKISRWTARRILNRAKLFARHPASKPMLTARHRKDRLQFALDHRHWSSVEWGKVIWSDETKVNMHNPDGGNWVRRPVGTRLALRNIIQTKKYGGGSLMAWGISFIINEGIF
jgi:hypothetical protein